MIITEIDNLTYNNNTNLYNLTDYTFTFDNVTLFPFTIEFRHEMRLDLVSLDIYGTSEFITVLCNINNIINPLSVKKDNIIYYADVDSINELAINIDKTNKLAESLINVNKKRKIDINRKEFNKRPILRNNSINNVTLNNGVITINPDF